MNNVAVILIDPRGKILALRVTYTKKRGWTIPGGNIDRGETTEYAISRELKEETGIVLKDYEIKSKTYYYYKDTKIFIVKIDHTPKIKLSFEHSDARWVTFKEYLSLDLEDYARKSIKSLFQDPDQVTF